MLAFRLPSSLTRTRMSFIALGMVMTAIAGLCLYLWWQNQHLNRLNQQQADQHQHALEQTTQSTLSLATLHSQQAELQKQVQAIQATASATAWQPLQAIFDAYQTIQTKINRNNLVKLDTSHLTQAYGTWGNLLLNKKFEELAQVLTQAQAALDDQYQQYQASLPKTTPPPTSANNGASSGAGNSNPTGYSALNVSTSRGTFAVKMIKLPLSQYTVKTVTAANTTCSSSCPAKSLAQFVTDNSAYAGINGSYFCPPDYGSCAGKTNTFDFAVYNSNTGAWHNPGARYWDSVGLITFTGQTAQAYKNGTSYTGHAVTAGISNFPPLILFNGQINSDEAKQSVAQTSRNYKGALGVNATDIFLVTASGVSMTDLAAVMKSVGATHALNLDGGGSGALYVNGSYKVGPGRLLPNAIVLVKR